jgi:hypothetical protein
VLKKAAGAGYVEDARLGDEAGPEEEIAALLLRAVALARARDVDAEDALRHAADAYRARFEAFERSSA